MKWLLKHYTEVGPNANGDIAGKMFEFLGPFESAEEADAYATAFAVELGETHAFVLAEIHPPPPIEPETKGPELALAVPRKASKRRKAPKAP